MNPTSALAHSALGILPWQIVNSKIDLSTEDKSSSLRGKKRSPVKEEKMPVSKAPRFRTNMVKA